MYCQPITKITDLSGTCLEGLTVASSTPKYIAKNIRNSYTRCMYAFASAQSTQQVLPGVEGLGAENILESSMSRCLRLIDKRRYVDVLLLGPNFSILLDMDMFGGLKGTDGVTREVDTNNGVNVLAKESTQMNKDRLREALDETVFVSDGSAFGLCLLLGPGEDR